MGSLESLVSIGIQTGDGESLRSRLELGPNRTERGQNQSEEFALVHPANSKFTVVFLCGVIRGEALGIRPGRLRVNLKLNVQTSGV